MLHQNNMVFYVTNINVENPLLYVLQEHMIWSHNKDRECSSMFHLKIMQTLLLLLAKAVRVFIYCHSYFSHSHGKTPPQKQERKTNLSLGLRLYPICHSEEIEVLGAWYRWLYSICSQESWKTWKKEHCCWGAFLPLYILLPQLVHWCQSQWVGFPHLN